MSSVTVVGAGFGALTAIRKLRDGDPNVQIDVVAPKPEFVYPSKRHPLNLPPSLLTVFEHFSS